MDKGLTVGSGAFRIDVNRRARTGLRAQLAFLDDLKSFRPLLLRVAALDEHALDALGDRTDPRIVGHRVLREEAARIQRHQRKNVDPAHVVADLNSVTFIRRLPILTQVLGVVDLLALFGDPGDTDEPDQGSEHPRCGLEDEHCAPFLNRTNPIVSYATNAHNEGNRRDNHPADDVSERQASESADDCA